MDLFYSVYREWYVTKRTRSAGKKKERGKVPTRYNIYLPVKSRIIWMMVKSEPYWGVCRLGACKLCDKRDVYLNKRERNHSEGSGPRVQGRQDLRNLTNIFRVSELRKTKLKPKNSLHRCMKSSSSESKESEIPRSQPLLPAFAVFPFVSSCESCSPQRSLYWNRSC